MRKLINAILFLGMLSLTAFAMADLSDSALVPKEESAFAKDYLQHLHDKDLAYVKSKMDAQLLAKVSDDQVVRITNYFPGGKILSAELIGSQVNIVDKDWFGNFTFEYHAEQGWAIANVVLKRVNDQLIVIAFSVSQSSASQKELNRFSFSGKSALQYIVMLAAACVPLFILVTLIACVKTPIPKRKWLWIICIILSVSAIDVNWTTGQYALQLLRFQLFGAAFMAPSEYAPWVITAGFPLGAIIFWFMRPKYLATAHALKNDTSKAVIL